MEKIEELNRRKFDPTDSECFCDACNEMEREDKTEKDLNLLGIINQKTSGGTNR
jgi:hypothetical protein